MKHLFKFSFRFSLMFIVCALMSFIVAFVPSILGISDINMANWNSSTSGFFGVVLFVELILSALFSDYSTNESEMPIGDIPKSYNLRSLCALMLFFVFSLVSFSIAYFPFAIGYANWNPDKWGTWGWGCEGEYASSFSAFVLFICLGISVCKAWEMSGKAFEK